MAVCLLSLKLLVNSVVQLPTSIVCVDNMYHGDKEPDDSGFEFLLRRNPRLNENYTPFYFFKNGGLPSQLEIAGFFRSSVVY